MDKMIKQIDFLLKYFKSELNDEDIRKVEKLLDSNKEFRRMYNVIKSLGVDCLPDDLTDLSPSLRQMSLNMFREYKKTDKDKTVTRGLPIFDSDVLPLPDGVRPSITNSRRLKYKFDDMEMELSLYPVSLYSYEMIGQISGSADKDHQIELVGNNFKRETATDELQMFVFAKIPAMKYRINILSGKKLKAFVNLDL